MEQFYPCVYILTNKPRGVLYTGVTSNLTHRLWQHKHGKIRGFSSKYNTERLVWYEVHDEIYAAITREKQIKKWNRDWKIELIESVNPTWKDRYEEILGKIESLWDPDTSTQRTLGGRFRGDDASESECLQYRCRVSRVSSGRICRRIFRAGVRH